MFGAQVFFYGTLLEDKTRQKALGRPVEGKRMSLPGWAKKTEKTFPYLVRREGSTVFGKVFELTKEDLDKLDDWEKKYYRIEVTLRDGSKAQVYEEAGH